MLRRRRSALSFLLVLVLGTLPASAQDPDPGSLRVTRAVGTAVRLTWTSATPTTYCMTRDPTAPPATLVASASGLSHVDDPPAPPSLPSIWFYDVQEAPAGGCSGTACGPAGALACGGTLSSRTDDASSTDALDAYPCRAGGFTGREVVTTFSAPADGDLDVRLSGTSTDLDVLLLRDGGAGCDPAACESAGDDRATLTVAAGEQLLIVVDGDAGTEGAFTVDVTCTPTATECSPAGDLECGRPAVGDTAGAGSSDVMSGYPGCAVTGLDGREQVWTFTATADDVVGVALTGGAADLDLVVLRDDGAGCDPAATCLAFEDAAATFDARAGATYHVVVDGAGPAAAYGLSVACSSEQCASLGQVTCGALRQDDNSNSGVSALSAYPCTTHDESGPEYVYEFVAAQTGDMTVSLTGMAADLDVVVMEDVLGCQADSCIAFGDSAVTFPIVAGTRYHVAVEGRDGAVSRYTATFSCNVPAQDCVPIGNLDCGQGQYSSNDALGRTDGTDVYPACASWDETGSEVAFQWIAPDDVTAIVSLSLTTEDLDVFVLQEGGAGCRPTDCIAHGDDGATFDAVEGRLYFFVVDGRAGARSDFRLFLDCIPAPGACLAATTLTCGQVVAGRNAQAGSSDAIDQWPACTPFPEDGPEVAYEFVATATGTADVALSGLTAELDVFVLHDTGSGCTSADCTTAGNDGTSFATVAGERYFIVVDGRSGASGDYTLGLDCR